MIFPQFSEIFYCIGSSCLLYNPSEFDSTETFPSSLYSLLQIQWSQMDSFMADGRGSPLRDYFPKWEFSLGPASQAVFPSASYNITTNKESVAGNSADNIVNDAWSRLESSCSFTAAAELQYEMKQEILYFIT